MKEVLRNREQERPETGGQKKPGLYLPAFLVLTILLILGVSSAGAQSANPAFTLNFTDCVTGNNQFYNSSLQKFRWYVNQQIGADGATGSIKCDSYNNDQYERPTDQTYTNTAVSELPPYTPPPTPTSATFLSGLLADTEIPLNGTAYAAEKYYEYVDITRASAGYDDTYMYFRIELFGEFSVDDSGSRSDSFGNGTYYSIRLGNTSSNDPRGGILLRDQRGTRNVSSTWETTADAKLFRDTDNKVGCSGGVTTPDEDGACPGSMTGYGLEVPNNNYLFVRRNNQSFTGPGGTVDRPYIEFAFNYALYNQNEAGADFTPQSINYRTYANPRKIEIMGE
jgi:hypothetical protein